MTRPAEIGQLNTTNWDQLEKLADRFEKAWRQSATSGGDPPDLTTFLPPPDDELRFAVLHELIKVEMEARWRLGQPTSLETYLARFPELGNPREVPATLIFEEFRVRQLYGDKPALTHYQGRFPAQFAELKKLHEDYPQATVTLPPGTKANIPTPPPPPKSMSSKKVPPVAPPPSPQGTQANVNTANFGGSTVMDDYVLIKRIGSGTFGEVWKAEAPGGVPVAVKIVIRPVDHEEAQRELAAMELIKMLQHPFLLQTHRFKPVGDRLMIVMELADGSLRDRAKQRRKEGKPGIPAPELVRYFKESAEALDFLHQNKVLHRDIKPENILLLKGHAKVADFGLARTGGAGASMFSATGCGTPAYMAPEVWRGKAAEHTDQYSLAVAYAELRLDRRLFTGGDFAQLMFAHLENTPDLKPLPEEEQKVILKAISKDPTKRYPNCTAFVEELEDALGDLIRRPNPSTARLLAPGPSAQNLSAVQGTDAMGTVGRQGLPSRMQSGTEAWKEEKKSGSAGTTVLVLILLAVLGFGGWHFFVRKGENPTPPNIPSFGLRELEPVGLHAGETKRVTLQIDRTNFAEPIALSFSDVPSNLTITPAESKVTGVSVFLDLQAGYEAEPGEYTIKIEAAAGDLKNSSKEFCVNLLPLLTLPSKASGLPDGTGCEKAAGAKVVSDSNGKKYYDRIELAKGNIRIPFKLIPTLTGSAGLPCFYMMENKVSVALFRQFAKEDPKGVRWMGWDGIAKSYGNDKFPVLGASVEDAHRFGNWLGGRLPSQKQWNWAAGLNEKSDLNRGPFLVPYNPKDPAQIAVNALAPLEVGTAKNDVSTNGIKDMAGNGREWTRDIQSLDRPEVPDPQATDKTVVYTRGRSFKDTEGPLTFRAMKGYESGTYLPKAKPIDPTDYIDEIGFRVILDLP